VLTFHLPSAPQTLASLSDFYDDDWLSVRVSVWWRCCTIVIGVAICGLVCVAVLPVFAGDVARDALADALRSAAQLLTGVVEVYLVVRSVCCIASRPLFVV
jgi:hypothetical protein